jgi:hypothetical protein
MQNQSKIKSFIRSLSALIVISLSSTAAHAQEDSLRYDGGRQAAKSIPGIDISAKKKPGTSNSNDRNRNADVVATSRTDAEGRFNLGVLPLGQYSITLRIPEENADNIESIIESLSKSAGDSSMAKTYSAAKSNTARVAVSGASSVSVVSNLELQKNRFLNQSALVFAQIYEMEIHVTGRQAVTGEVSISIERPGVK